MFSFIVENFQTAITTLLVAVIMAMSIIKIVHDIRKSKPVGCGCGSCRCLSNGAAKR
jgi:bacterioferritin-associated ferredoxin